MRSKPGVDKAILRHWTRPPHGESPESHPLQNESVRQEPSPRKVQVLVPYEETTQGQEDPGRDRLRPRGL